MMLPVYVLLDLETTGATPTNDRITENRQVSVDTHAETGTDKLLRRLDERENAEHNAELKTHDEHIK